jgi:glycine cleavage system H protein
MNTRIPETLAYTRNHEWLSRDGDIATIGITDFAQSELGDIVFVELPEIGAKIEQEVPFGTVEAVKTVEDLIAPAAGEVVAVNQTLAEHAEQINEDPYGAGWMIKIRLADDRQLESLLNAQGYAELIEDR